MNLLSSPYIHPYIPPVEDIPPSDGSPGMLDLIWQSAQHPLVLIPFAVLISYVVIKKLLRPPAHEPAGQGQRGTTSTSSTSDDGQAAATGTTMGLTGDYGSSSCGDSGSGGSDSGCSF